MARIPDVMSLGERPAVRTRSARLDDQSAEILGQAGEGLGNTLFRVADRVQGQRLALARAKAQNAILDHEISVRGKSEEIRSRIESGQLKYGEAAQTFEKEMSAIAKPDLTDLDPVGAEILDRGFKRNLMAGNLAVSRVVEAAERDDFKSQFASGLDNLGKLGGMPGADIESINSKADAFVEVGLRAGVPRAVVEKSVQDFKDRNWLNDATQKAMMAAHSMPALKQLEHELTAADGFYANKLDTEKRNAVLRSVLNDRAQLENRIRADADRREARADRTLYQIDAQISSGVPATAEMWAHWGAAVQGTPAEAEFRQRLDAEAEVQAILRQPIASQVTFVQEREAKLDAEGGSLRDRGNLVRLKSAVQANVKLMQDAPLLFSANRTGEEITPLDLSGLGSDEELGSKLGARMDSLLALRKQYGADIPLKPLLPQEAQQLSQALDKATPQQQTELFAALRSAIGDVDAYRGVMQQIAPDAPVKAIAGLLAAKEATLTLDTHWFRPDDVANSQAVASTMLEGARLLDATKGQKTEDGKPKTGLFLPEDATLQGEFQNTVGTVFRGRPQAADIAFQAVKAYYVGKAAQTGRLAADNKDIDSDLIRESITATLGTVVDFNGHGEVLAPWGMSEEVFQQRAQAAWLDTAKRLGYPPASPRIGLQNQGEGSYFVTQGRNYLTDAQGQPVIINVNP